MFSQDFVLDLVSKATVLLLAISLADWSLQKRTSAGVRHRVWAAAFVALLLLPLLSATVPRWRLAILPAQWGQTEERLSHPIPVGSVVDSLQSTEAVEFGLNERHVNTPRSDWENNPIAQNDMFATRAGEEDRVTEPKKQNGEAEALAYEPATSIFASW